MPLEIVIEPSADKDLDAQLDYLAERNLDAAIRYYDAAMRTFNRLADMPGIGRLPYYTNPKLADIRTAAISQFPNYLVFYRATALELRIVRVLHGAQNVEEILAPED
jgi:toxin ParE1/3/4